MVRLAQSLETLRDEVNAWAPRRSKASDGWLGDPAHQARASRHNANRYSVVTALDLTHDPAGGCDIHAIARRLVRDPHPELAYVISNGQVAKRSAGFQWQPYTGENAHRLHAHFAVGQGPDSDPLPPYDSMLSWGVSLTPEQGDDELNDADKQWIAQQFDAHRKWVRAELGSEQGKSLYEKIRANADTLRDSLAALIRGGG
jgi:hypothetical protein